MFESHLSYLPNPSARAVYDTQSIFKRSLTGLNSEFSFSKAEEPSLPYYLPIGGGRIFGFIPFQMVLVLCEMQSVSFRIWTRVAVSCDDNHYTTGTSSIGQIDFFEDYSLLIEILEAIKVYIICIKNSYPNMYIINIFSFFRPNNCVQKMTFIE